MISSTETFDRVVRSQIDTVSRRNIWAGRILSGIPVLFLLFDAVGKLLKLQPVVEGTVSLGYSENVIVPLGILLLICVVLYVIPLTSILGVILLTGYLGGAVATHVRISNPLFSHVLFPVYVALLLYAGLILRDERVRALLARKR